VAEQVLVQRVWNRCEGTESERKTELKISRYRYLQGVRFAFLESEPVSILLENKIIPIFF
jgi:hypothetical protein